MLIFGLPRLLIVALRAKIFVISNLIDVQDAASSTEVAPQACMTLLIHDGQAREIVVFTALAEAFRARDLRR